MTIIYTMELMHAYKLVLRSLALAALATLFVLSALEWIMPGSVLPFVNLIVITPTVVALSLLLLIGAAWEAGAINWIQIGAGLALGVLILAFLASIVGYSSLSQLGLLGATCLCLIAWAYIQLNTEFHN